MGVKLEIFRMILYLTFPVAMFWVSNQAEWFEGYVIQRQRELWTPEKPSRDRRIKEEGTEAAGGEALSRMPQQKS
uniref:PET100 cytochrome c oxidase chaperone n=1 Tax=Cercocebus atys TaxID=9531 RepID=A0A2K5NT62_CERAT